MLGVGGGLGITTFVFFLFADFNGADTSANPLLLGMGTATGVLLAAGTSLTAYGAVRVERDPEVPAVALGLGSIRLRWSF